MIYIPIAAISHSFIDYPSPENCTTIYTVGCKFNCEGCHNSSLFENKGFPKFNMKSMIKVLKKFAIKHRTNNICIMGGEPLLDTNIKFVSKLTRILTKKGFNICIYTGETVENVKLLVKKYNIKFEYIKIGRYVKKKKQTPEKTDEKFVLASTNQTIFNNNFEQLTHEGILTFN